MFNKLKVLRFSSFIAIFVIGAGLAGCGNGLKQLSAGEEVTKGPDISIDLSSSAVLPVAVVGGDMYVTATAGALVTLDGSGSLDPRGVGLQYHWRQTSGAGGELQDSQAARAHFVVPTVSGSEKFTFSLTVSDDKHSSEPAVISVFTVDSSAGAAVGIYAHPFVGWAKRGFLITDMVLGNDRIFLPYSQVIDAVDPLRLSYIPYDASVVQDGTTVLNIEYENGILYEASVFQNGYIRARDFTNPSKPTVLGSYILTGVEFSDFAVDNGTLYCVVGGAQPKLMWFSLSTPYGALDPAAVNTPIKQLNLGGTQYPRTLRVVGNKVFVAQAEDGVKIVDMSAAAGPTLVFSTDTPGTAVDLAVANGYVFVADSLFGVQVIKADTGSLLANIETKATVDHIAADDAHVYVREGYNDVVYYELGSGFYKEVNRIKRAQPDILRALNGFLYVGDSIGGIYAYNTKLFGKPESSPVFADANHSVISINPLKNSRLYTTLRTTGNTLNEINGVRILDVGRAKAVSIAGNDFSKGLAFDTAVISDVALPPIAYSLEKDAFGSNYINVINFTNGVKPMQSSVVADGSVMSMSLDGETLYTLNNITSMSSASPGGNMAGGVFAYDVSTPTHIKLINKIQWSGSAYYGGLAAYKDKIITADFSGLRIFDKTQLMTNGAAVTLNDAYLTGMNNDIVMYGDLAIIAQSTGIITYDFATASNLRTDIYKQAQLSFNDEIKRLSVLTGGRVLATQNSGAYSILDVQQGGNLSIVAGLNFDNAITSASVVNDKFYFVDKSGSVNMVDVTPPVLAPRFAQSDVKAGMQLNYSVSWVDYHDAVDTICKVSVGSCTVLRDGKKTNAAILEWQLPTDAIDMNIALRFVVGNGAHFNSAVTYLSVP